MGLWTRPTSEMGVGGLGEGRCLWRAGEGGPDLWGAEGRGWGQRECKCIGVLSILRSALRCCLFHWASAPSQLTPGLGVSTLDSLLVGLGACLGFGVARKTPFRSFPVEPLSLLCAAVMTEVPVVLAPLFQLCTLQVSTGSTGGICCLTYFPHLNFLWFLWKETHLVPFSVCPFFKHIPMPVTFVLPPPLCPPLPPPLLSVCCLSSQQRLPLTAYSTSKHLHKQERIWYVRVAGTLRITVTVIVIVITIPVFKDEKKKMTLGSCNVLAQVTKMLNGPAKIFDFQFTAFPKCSAHLPRLVPSADFCSLNGLSDLRAWGNQIHCLLSPCEKPYSVCFFCDHSCGPEYLQRGIILNNVELLFFLMNWC